MARPLTSLQLYAQAFWRNKLAQEQLGAAHEVANRAVNAKQEAWHVVQQDRQAGRVKYGVHIVGAGEAILVSTGDYPEVQPLIATVD